MQIPAFLLTETVRIEPYQGITVDGPAFGSPTTVRAHVQDVTKLPKGVKTARYEVWIRVGTSCPIGSRIQVRGESTTAATVEINDGRGLAVPSHVAIVCERIEFLPSTTITIRRGTTTDDEYGDPIPSTAVVAAGVPASVVETDQTRTGPSDMRGGVVETYEIRLRSTVEIVEGDRLTDDRSGHVYQVLDVEQQQSTTGPALGMDDVHVTARRVAPHSTPNG